MSTQNDPPLNSVNPKIRTVRNEDACAVVKMLEEDVWHEARLMTEEWLFRSDRVVIFTGLFLVFATFSVLAAILFALSLWGLVYAYYYQKDYAWNFTCDNHGFGDLEKHYQSRPRWQLWVAETNDGVVGMIAVEETEEEKVAELRKVRVVPRMQRCGVGSRLLETALAHCRDKGFAWVIAITYQGGTAFRFYKKK